MITITRLQELRNQLEDAEEAFSYDQIDELITALEEKEADENVDWCEKNSGDTEIKAVQAIKKYAGPILDAIMAADACGHRHIPLEAVIEDAVHLGQLLED